ncbi:MAG: molybdenum ABC transporter ATP-binding protein [Stappiaceae bacterium]
MLSVNVKGQFGPFDIDTQFDSTGGVTALFGRSGSGKTTLVNMISGLVKPRTGRITLNDVELFNAKTKVNMPARLRQMGHVFQEHRLFPHISVRRNLTFAAWAGGRPKRRPLEEVVDLLGIEHLLERSPAKLSGGEKQRVAIGRALLSSPRALLMDEPLASLDAARKEEILPYLDRLCREAKIPIVYVSHAIEEVVRLADTLVVLSEGRVKASGPVADILTRLDLGPATGRHEAGALIRAKVIGFDPNWMLVKMDVEGQQLELPGANAPVGQEVRLRIRARDVSIATQDPEGVSIRNRLRGTVEALRLEEGPYAEVVCRVGTQKIRARLTRASAHDLGLVIGLPVFVLIKSIAFGRPLGTKGY